MKEVIIIGSGPAGITAGIYLTRSNIKNTVITNNTGSLKKADKIENYYGFEKPISGEKLIENGINQYINLGGNIIEDEVVGLTYEDKLVVKGTKENYQADYVVIATGISRLLPNINGLSDKLGISYCAICDAFFYRDKDVVVIGNGKYAKAEADILCKTSKSVKVLSNGKDFMCDFSCDTEKRKISSVSKINTKFEIKFEDDSILVTDGIFIAEGIAGAMALAKKIGAKTENNKIIVNDKMKTNIPNLYAVGDCNGGIYQISKAVYDGTIAALEIIKENKKE